MGFARQFYTVIEMGITWKSNFFFGLAALLCSGSAKAEPDSSHYAIDLTGNFYTINHHFVLVQYNSSGDSLRSISLAQYGSEPILDVSNPMEIFVFYLNNGKTIVLDNQLNIKQENELFSKQWHWPTAIGRANDGNILLYDAAQQTVKKLNRQGETVAESMVITLAKQEFTEKRIIDIGNLILLCTNTTWFFFSPNLNLLSEEQKSQTQTAFFTNNKIGFFKSDTLFCSDHKNGIVAKQKPKILSSQKEILAANNSFILLKQGDSVILQRLNW